MAFDKPLTKPALFRPAVTISECPGVIAINERSTRTIRRIALAVVVTPFLGFLIALFLLWGRGIGYGELGTLVAMYSATIIGIGVGFHRHFSHRSFQTPTIVRVILAILGSMAAQGPVLFWAALHRRHHSKSDKAGDPHSPHLHGEGLAGLLRGLWHAHTGWLFVYENTDWAHYVPDLLRDRIIFKVNQLYFLWVFLGLAIPALLGGLVTESWDGAFRWFLWGGLVRVFLVHHATWSVNSITHVVGSRAYRSHDESRNNFLIALLAFGEGWHNNHHAFPTSAKHGLEWWQIDLNGWVISFLKMIGCAWEVKTPSPQTLAESRMMRRSG